MLLYIRINKQTQFHENISEEIRDLTEKDIGQKLGNIGQMLRTLGRNWGHLVDIRDMRLKLRTLGRHLADFSVFS